MNPAPRLVLAAAAIALPASLLAQDRSKALGDLSLEELGNIEVTSVSRHAEKLSDAAASIYVVTGEEIRRSGATNIPDALRLVPTLQVARTDSRNYAISARGFNNAIGNKLLVLIDGRTVYSPLFSGVQWDQQDVMMEDIDRIEVISGPGAALWGANAVNGVINIITRSASATQGVVASVVSGNTESTYALRYGLKLGESGALRFYGKLSDQNRTRLANGADVLNSWGRDQVGFRADFGGGADSFTLQGDAYRGGITEQMLGTRPGFTGANLLARWNRRFADGSDLKVQGYVDRADRDDVAVFRDHTRTTDIEVQYGFRLGERHRFLVGGGRRLANDKNDLSLLVRFVPQTRELRWSNLFAQDEISLRRDLQLTLGAKLESNVYTGWEFLPSARLAWKPDARRLVWGALSRAVRAPARLDRDFFFPGNAPFLITGGPNFQSEISNVIELGYRAQPSDALNYSLTLFHSAHERLRSGQLPPAQVQNGIEGSSSGLEASGTWQATRNWRLTGGLTTLKQRLHVVPGSTDPTGPSALGNDPDYQWMLRSLLNLPHGWEFDVSVRRVAALPNPVVPAYDAVDARLGWRVTRELELSLIFRNGFDPQHPEFGALAGRNEIPRSALVRLLWRQ